MLGPALMLVFCLLVGLISLVVCGWVLITGQLLTLDGLLLTFISLAIGGIFLASFAWSVHNGELREILNSLRKRSGGADAASAPQQEGRK